MRTRQSNSLSDEYLYGQTFYPASPFSWLAPLWSFLCGAAASGAWTWTTNSILRFLLGVFLSGPLLGIVWSASTQIRWRDLLTYDPPSKVTPKPIPALPYTLPGSASEQLGSWLSTFLARWQQVKPYLGKPLLQLIASSVFSLTVAAQLGQQSLILTAAGLGIAYVSSLDTKRRISVLAPLFLAWLLGHTIYSTIHLASALIAVFFAVTLYSAPKQMETGLIWQVMPQIAIVAGLVTIKQPLVATAVALLSTLGVLLIPLLQTQSGREKYFRIVQLQLAASMLLSALALGYKP